MAQQWTWVGADASDAVKDKALALLSTLLGRTPLYGQDRILTASATVVDTDDLILVDSTAGAVDVTLPASVGWRGRRLSVKWIAGANTVRLIGTIDGAANYTLPTVLDAVEVKSCRTALPATFAWEIVAKPGTTGGALTDGDKGDIVVSGAGTVWAIDSAVATTAGRALMDDATAADQRTTLGLGTLATQNGTFSGTSSGTNTGDQSLFATVAVSGQTSIEADSATDTLTLVAGDSIVLTTDATTDTLTVAVDTASGNSLEWKFQQLLAHYVHTLGEIPQGLEEDYALALGAEGENPWHS